jgi:endoglucanase
MINNSRISVAPKDKGVEINVFLDKLLPKELEGKAGFNLEFLPSAYFEKTYLVDGNPGIFPKYPAGNTEIEPISKKIPQFSGHITFDDRGRGEFIVPDPIATGKTFVFAPEDPERFVRIKSLDADMMRIKMIGHSSGVKMSALLMVVPGMFFWRMLLKSCRKKRNNI